MKVAITSSDGVSVNTHFGRAEKFYIYNVYGVEKEFVEERTCQKYCNHSECVPHDFDKDKFERVYDTIKDCEVLYTAQIGDKPAEKLNEKNIKVIVFDGLIEKIV